MSVHRRNSDSQLLTQIQDISVQCRSPDVLPPSIFNIHLQHRSPTQVVSASPEASPITLSVSSANPSLPITLPMQIANYSPSVSRQRQSIMQIPTEILSCESPLSIANARSKCNSTMSIAADLDLLWLRDHSKV